ncbi:Polyisoprenoid-binding protein YceI [Thiohalospira halophila DSM 15071]|uniref:Polyisoprenoid-binding protein YceI n=1 Tax=Thiohalospira halophila DSM 15071 TaxID=1123397 RepID=A0A1I1TPV3_9GAMM|nr:YceI family protein [Thiohalospira halophila]SFD60632.1 Polyisoprenoid-binding protein YceI [Thiohalospira halophila DSM 15071]
MKRLFALALGIALSAPAAAEWTLDNEASDLNYISIKAGHTGEVNEFEQLSGSLEEGRAEVTIDLASVDTGVDIRDERMRDMFFKVDNFPTAELTAEFEATLVKNLFPGDMTRARVSGELTLQGDSQELEMPVRLLRLDEDTLVATSAAPVVINAADFGLTESLKALREVAGLDTISRAVPVHFNLVFRRD